jgi:hypothetical protein
MQGHAELRVPVRPVLRRLVLDDRTLEKQDVHVVTVRSQALGEVVIRRRDATIAHGTDDLLGDDRYPESALRLTHTHGINTGEDLHLEVIALHPSPFGVIHGRSARRYRQAIPVRSVRNVL